MDRENYSNEKVRRKQHSEDNDNSSSSRSVRARTMMSSPSDEKDQNLVLTPHLTLSQSPISSHVVPLQLGPLPSPPMHVLMPHHMPFDLNLNSPPTPTPFQFLGPSPTSQSPPLPLPPVHADASVSASSSVNSSTIAVLAARRPRRNPTQGPREGRSETIPPPYPWATNRRAMVYSLKYLVHNQIHTITGDVQCKRCERKFVLEFDLTEKFYEVYSFIAEKKDDMHDRAPDVWMNPTLPTCKHCGQENSVKPIIPLKGKKTINWLFLLLGQMLGLCSLDQLKYFCKHTRNHRTGAKDRVLYLTYLALCKQLYPEGPFTR
ncbi:hypothetical protein RIF29_13038 [Crotalaria pallida]|uniref:DUF7086 domain-containing protein n=1 Tax=Crotalaria pallida TaxID=3830 RepID=A0AAN9P1M8_CROPI